MTTQLMTAQDVNPLDLTRFLELFFGTPKADFLRDHGAWLHAGQENRWVLLVDKVIAGYCAVIPTRVSVENNVLPAIWWVDIIVAPEFRGQGLQSHFDQKLKQDNLLKLGFPNELAAKIHRKHNWGVREDLLVRLCPLRPLSVNQVSASHGSRGFLLKLGALALSPLMAAFRFWLGLQKPKSVFQLDHPSPAFLSGVVSRAPASAFATTSRDEPFFQHRFLDAPYTGQLSYFFYGPVEAPTHYLISRTLLHKGHVVTRVLDLFGDFTDQKAICNLLLAASADAAKNHSAQITVMSTLPEINVALRSTGFFFNTPARFCWLSDDPHLMRAFDHAIYFTLADSDNDEIG